MDSWSILLSLSLLVLSIQCLANKIKSKRLPPGPTALPIIGNLHNLGKIPHQSLANLANIHGPIMSLKLGQLTTIVISSSTLAREVLKKQDLAFSSRYVPEVVTALDYHRYSVAWLPVCDRWRSLRKIINTSMFSAKALDANQHIRTSKVHDLIAHCANICKDGKALDMGQIFFLTSLNLLSNAIFSKDITDPKQDSLKQLKELISTMFVEAGKPNLSDFFPVLKKIDPQRLKARMSVYSRRFHQLLDGFINERLEFRKFQKCARTSDLLDLCLDINEQNPQEIDIDHMRSTFLDLFLGGTDTTSSTLEWAMAELLSHPETMIKAKVELDQVIGKGKIVGEEDISRLPYLECILKETLRLHPPAPFLGLRKVENDVEVNGYFIPKGSQVLVNAWAIGRDSHVWENSATFNPDRFLTSKRDVRGQDFELIPFGAGRRICPALSLALRAMPITLGSLINSFDWKLGCGIEPNELDMSDQFGLTVRRAHPLLVVPMPLMTM